MSLETIQPPQIPASETGRKNEHVRKPKATQESFQRKLNWMKAAIEEGAHEVVPMSKMGKLTPSRWDMIRDIGFLYAFTDATLEELGSGKIPMLKGWSFVHREQIRKENKRFIINLWNNCSPELQRKYPLDTIPFDKPLSQVSRQRRSASKNGPSSKVLKELHNANTDPKAIMEATGINRVQFKAASRVLNGWREKVEELSLLNTSNVIEKLEERIDEAGNDDVKLQKLLESMPRSITYYLRIRRAECPLMYLHNVARGLGFSFRSLDVFVEALKSKGIPIRDIKMGIQNKNGKKYPIISWVFFAKHKARVEDALDNSEELKRYRKTPLA